MAAFAKKLEQKLGFTLALRGRPRRRGLGASRRTGFEFSEPRSAPGRYKTIQKDTKPPTHDIATKPLVHRRCTCQSKLNPAKFSC
jgi:hypothetical protein